MKLKCPRCGSTKLYNECSVIAKIKVNANKNGEYKIYDIVPQTDNIFAPTYCNDCGWCDSGFEENTTDEELEKFNVNLEKWKG